jgi:hypothetical protein
MKKTVTIIIIFAVSAAALLVCGILIYRNSVKTDVLEICEKYVRLYEFDILPDEYRKDKYPDCVIPEEFVQENLLKIDERYRELFDVKKYSSEVKTKTDWYTGKIITGEVILEGYRVSIKEVRSFKLSGFNKAEIFIIVSQKGVNWINKGGYYADESFAADVGYKIVLNKTDGQWKIGKVSFISGI